MIPPPLLSLGFNLLGNWQKYLIIGLVILAAAGVVWMHGYGKGSSRLFEYKAEQAEEAVRIIVKRGEVTEKVVTKYVERKAKTQVVTQTIEKEVIKYAEANPGVCLDRDFRRLHDQSALNLSESSKPVDGEGGAPPASTVLETVTKNYSACHRTADRLDALQEWVREQGQVQ